MVLLIILFFFGVCFNLVPIPLVIFMAFDKTHEDLTGAVRKFRSEMDSFFY